MFQLALTLSTKVHLNETVQSQQSTKIANLNDSKASILVKG